MPWQDFILPSRVAAKTKPELSQCLARGCRIPQECLPFFTDLPVRVFVHDDEPGLKVARRWAGQLAGAGARVGVGERVNIHGSQEMGHGRSGCQPSGKG